MARRQLTPWFCSVCTISGPRFGDRAAFVDHFRRFCHRCSLEFTSHRTYQFHLGQSHPPGCCPLCARGPEYHSLAHGHGHARFGCARCGKGFSSFRRLVGHNAGMACSPNEGTPSVLAPIQPSAGHACSSCRLAVEDLEHLHQHFQSCPLALERDVRNTALSRTEVLANIHKSLQPAQLCHPLHFADDRLKEKPPARNVRPSPMDVDHEESLHPSLAVGSGHCQRATESAISIQRQIHGRKQVNGNLKPTPLKLDCVEVIELIDDDDERDNDVQACCKPLPNPSMPMASTQENNPSVMSSLPLRNLSASFRHRIRSKSQDLIQSDLDVDTHFLESFLLQPVSVRLNRWPSDQPVPSLVKAIPVDWEQESKLEEALNLLEYRGIDVDQLINDSRDDASPCEEMSEVQEDFGHILTDPIHEPGNLLIGTNSIGWVTVARQQYEESVPVITLE